MYVLDSIARLYQATARKVDDQRVNYDKIDASSIPEGTYLSGVLHFNEHLETVLDNALASIKDGDLQKSRIGKLIDIWLKAETFDSKILNAANEKYFGIKVSKPVVPVETNASTTENSSSPATSSSSVPPSKNVSSILESLASLATPPPARSNNTTEATVSEVHTPTTVPTQNLSVSTPAAQLSGATANQPPLSSSSSAPPVDPTAILKMLHQIQPGASNSGSADTSRTSSQQQFSSPNGFPPIPQPNNFYGQQGGSQSPQFNNSSGFNNNDNTGYNNSKGYNNNGYSNNNNNGYNGNFNNGYNNNSGYNNSGYNNNNNNNGYNSHNNNNGYGNNNGYDNNSGYNNNGFNNHNQGFSNNNNFHNPNGKRRRDFNNTNTFDNQRKIQKFDAAKSALLYPGEANEAGTPHFRPRNTSFDNQLPANTIKVLSRTLFIGGVNRNTDELSLANIFRPYGEVQSVILNIPKKHAFVKVYSRAEAINVMTNFKGSDYNLRLRWGVGFGPRDCCDYQHGISVIPISRLTDADQRWITSAEWGGTGGAPIVPGLVIDEPDIEIGNGVSSKAISKKMPTDGSRNGPRSTKPGVPDDVYTDPLSQPNNTGSEMTGGSNPLANLFGDNGNNTIGGFQSSSPPPPPPGMPSQNQAGPNDNAAAVAALLGSIPGISNPGLNALLQQSKKD